LRVFAGKKANFLIQGTIAADIKETKEGIKTQHNVLSQVGINPKKYGFEVIEPLRNLYKPEVRMIAKRLGLPKKIFGRMPFPGPGLALRVIGKVTPERIKIVREATAIVEKKLERFLPFQCFAVLLSDKATGIRDKKRAFGNIIVIRSVDSEDAMTACPTKIPLEILFDLQKKICQKIPSVTKVLYDLTPKPPSTIEYI
jgi:GMP synthase (glutamine-hydrolysing)